jgi:pSer/pThr/pTyr-binding forkhead associated (FHA) protein
MAIGRRATRSSGLPSRERRRYRIRHGTDEIEVAGPITVGRDDDCEIVLGGGLVSRRHARLFETEDGLSVEDLKSLNGVFVNQRRISEPTLLAHGDVIGIGLDALEVSDVVVSPRKDKPTLPAPIASIPDGESDVDGPEQVTVTTRLDVLTDREREVFELIVLGHTQREIGEKLHVSVKTIESHRAHIAEKLRCRTRAELVAYAITSGILQRPLP